MDRTRYNSAIYKLNKDGDVDRKSAGLYIRDYVRRYEPDSSSVGRPDRRLPLDASTYDEVRNDYKYDLQNMGWNSANVSRFRKLPFTGYVPADGDEPEQEGNWPSLADSPILLKRNDDGTIKTDTFLDNTTNRSYAPIGGIILGEGTTRIAEEFAEESDEDTTSFGPGPTLASCYYGGRLFFVFDNRPQSSDEIEDGTNHSPSRIYFSQLAPNEARGSKRGTEESPITIPCFSDNDPTAAVNNIATEADGGYIDVASGAVILQLIPTRTGIVVSSDIGIYFVTGSDLNSFNPLEVRVDKISEANGVSHFGGVVAEDVVFLWTTEGILVVGPNENNTAISAQNISRGKIDGLVKEAEVEPEFTNILGSATVENTRAKPPFYEASKTRIDVRAVFDSTKKTVNWLYRTQGSTLFYNKELVFSLFHGAFTTNEYPSFEGRFVNYGIVGAVDTRSTYDISREFKDDIADTTTNRTKSSLIYLILVDRDGRTGINLCTFGGAIGEGADSFRDYFKVSPVDQEDPILEYNNEFGMGGTAVGSAEIEIDYIPEGQTERTVLTVEVVFGEWQTAAVAEPGTDVLLTATELETQATIPEQVPYIDSGEFNLEVPEAAKDGMYVYSYMRRTEDGFVQETEEVEEDEEGNVTLTEIDNWFPSNESGLLIKAAWNWADSDAGAKMSVDQQVYKLLREYMPQDLDDKFDYGQYLITNKIKVRGRGKSLRIIAEGEEGKDAILLGFGMNIRVNEE